MAGKNIQVAVKVRPLLKKEKEAKLISNWKIVDNSIQLIESQTDPFYFDHIFNQDVSNQIIFDKVAKPIVDATLQGFNGTIFAYGQTSSGKTYTMLGDEINPGVMVLAAKEIFNKIENASDRQFLLRVGYIEIYNEKIYDLLNKNNQDLKIHETPNGDVSVNCEDPIITSESEMMYYLQTGSKLRKCGETNMNERSSRSHALFRMIIESRKVDLSNDDGCVQTSILNLVDLAGSERADQTGATGSRLNEGRHINRSLLYLSCVIKRLSENESDKYVNYRDSKLTRILQASLGGNALTAIICTIKPTSVEETNSTLSFAMRAKTIKNKPEVNETLSDAAMMKRLEKEISRLQCELEVEKNKNSKIYENKLRVLQLESQIKEESLKIIHSNTIGDAKRNQIRRRTWCPSSTEILAENLNKMKYSESNSNNDTAQPENLLTPVISQKDDLICMCNGEESNSLCHNCFYNNETLSNSMQDAFEDIKTPKVFKLKKLSSLSPLPDFRIRYLEVVNEMEELRQFTNLEKKFEVDNDTIASLSKRLELSDNNIAVLKKQENELKLVIDDLKQNALKNNEKFQYFESKIAQDSKNFENIKLQLEEKNKQIQELLKDNQNLQFKCSEQISIEYEYEQFRTKCKNREAELIDTLNEKDNTISKLKIELENLRTSKDSICNTCNLNSDVFYKLQNNLELFKLENERIQKEHDELSSQLVESIQDNETLKNNYIEAQKEINSLNLIINEFVEIKDELVVCKDNLLRNNETLNKIISFYKKGNYKIMTEFQNQNKKLEETCSENLHLSHSILNLQKKNESEKLYVGLLLEELQYYLYLLNEKFMKSEIISDIESKTVTTPTELQESKLQLTSLSQQYSHINYKHNNSILSLSSNEIAKNPFLRLPINHISNNIDHNLIDNIREFQLNGNPNIKMFQYNYFDIPIFYNGNWFNVSYKITNPFQKKNITFCREINTDTVTKIFLDLKQEYDRKQRQLIQDSKRLYNLKEVYDKKCHHLKKFYELPTNLDERLLQIETKKELKKEHERELVEAKKICLEDYNNKNKLKELIIKKDESFNQLNYKYYDLKDNYNTIFSILTNNKEKLGNYIIRLEKELSLLEDMNKNISLLEEECSDNKILLNQNEKELENYKKIILDLKHENNELIQSKKIYAEEEYEKTKLLLLKSEIRLGEYEIENKNLKADLKEQTEILNKYKEEINLFKIDENINNKKCKNIENDNNKLRIELDSKINEIKSLININSDYSTKILNNNVVINQMETECHSLKESTSKLKEYIITLEEESRLLRIEKINNIKEQDMHQNEIENFKNIACNLDKDRIDLEHKLKDCLAEKDNLKKNIQEINICKNESTSKLKEYIITLEEESRLLRIEKNNNIKQQEFHQNEIENFKNIACNLDKDRVDLEHKLKDCLAEKDNLKKHIQEINICKNDSTSKLKEYIITLEEESRLLRIEKNNNIKQQELHQNEIENFENIACNLDKNRIDLEHKLKDCLAEKDNLKKHIQEINIFLQSEKINTLALESKLKEISLEKQHLQDSLLQYEDKLKKLLMETTVQDKVKNLNVSQNDRKYRRQSTHDEKRQSLWDCNRTVSTMTSPTDQLCGCIQLNEKLSTLKKNMLIKDSQINTLRLELKSNLFKDEVKKYQMMVLEMENEKKKLLLEITNLKRQIIENTSAASTSNGINFLNKKSSENMDATVQQAEKILKISNKCEDLQNICRMRNDRIIKLESEICHDKENQVTQQSQIEEQLKVLNEDHRILKKKYEEAKTLCRIRIEQISDLKKTSNEQLAMEKNEQFLIISNKYEDLKSICRLRNKRIKELEEKISHLQENQ